MDPCLPLLVPEAIHCGALRDRTDAAHFRRGQSGRRVGEVGTAEDADALEPCGQKRRVKGVAGTGRIDRLDRVRRLQVAAVLICDERTVGSLA